MDRRAFIKTAALTTASFGFPTIVPASVFGKEGATAPGNQLIMGCIGVGGQGVYNMKNFLGFEEVKVVAVCDVDQKHLEEARDLVNENYRNRDCASYRDFRELLARPDIDMVTVCTPDHWHGSISVAAAKAGKDIYCEKPLTNTIAEGRALLDAVHEYGRILQTGSHERSRQNARIACELVRNGRLGKVQTIQINLPCNESHHLAILNDEGDHPPKPIPPELDWELWLGPVPHTPYIEKRCHFGWRFVMDTGGGEMTDRGAHVIDLGQLGLGTDHATPIEYEATGELPKSNLFNTYFNFKFECRYANGVRMIGTSQEPRGVKFIGPDGWIFIHVHGGHLEAEPASLLREKIGFKEIHLGRSPGHHRDFVNAVKTRTQPMAPVEVGYHTAVICHLLNISVQTGKKLQWDPVKEKVLNCDEANKLLARPMRSPWVV
jgi:predicted dehydrogenase